MLIIILSSLAFGGTCSDVDSWSEVRTVAKGMLRNMEKIQRKQQRQKAKRQQKRQRLDRKFRRFLSDGELSKARKVWSASVELDQESWSNAFAVSPRVAQTFMRAIDVRVAAESAGAPSNQDHIQMVCNNAEKIRKALKDM